MLRIGGSEGFEAFEEGRGSLEKNHAPSHPPHPALSASQRDFPAIGSGLHFAGLGFAGDHDALHRYDHRKKSAGSHRFHRANRSGRDLGAAGSFHYPQLPEQSS